jgi:hypothetical protein
MLCYKRGRCICHVYQRHPGISIQRRQDKEWCTNMGRSHSPTSLTERSPKELLLSVYTQRYKTVYLEKSVIDPLFVGIVSIRGDDHIMSVSKGGKPDFEEFNLSSLYQMSQE